MRIYALNAIVRSITFCQLGPSPSVGFGTLLPAAFGKHFISCCNMTVKYLVSDRLMRQEVMNRLNYLLHNDISFFPRLLQIAKCL